MYLIHQKNYIYQILMIMVIIIIIFLIIIFLIIIYLYLIFYHFLYLFFLILNLKKIYHSFFQFMKSLMIIYLIYLI